MEPRFLQVVEWCVTSLRRFGRHGGDVAVITDQSGAALPAAVRAQATVVPVDESRLRDPGHGRSAYERYLMARLRAHHLIDVAAYDRVLYVDCDVLATLAETMRGVYEADPDLLAARGAAGAARVRGMFTWKHVGDRIERCLREAATGV